MRNIYQETRFARAVTVLSRHALTRTQLAGRFALSPQATTRLLEQIAASYELRREQTVDGVTYRIQGDRAS